MFSLKKKIALIIIILNYFEKLSHVCYLFKSKCHEWLKIRFIQYVHFKLPIKPSLFSSSFDIVIVNDKYLELPIRAIFHHCKPKSVGISQASVRPEMVLHFNAEEENEISFKLKKKLPEVQAHVI